MVQKNSEYEHFLRSEIVLALLSIWAIYLQKLSDLFPINPFSNTEEEAEKGFNWNKWIKRLILR